MPTPEEIALLQQIVWLARLAAGALVGSAVGHFFITQRANRQRQEHLAVMSSVLESLKDLVKEHDQRLDDQGKRLARLEGRVGAAS